MGLDDHQKNMIHLIDFPGFEVQNIFEKKINKVISICSFFIFVVKEIDFNTLELKKIVNEIFTQANEQKEKLTSQIAKTSLFVINNYSSINITDKDIDKAKLNIKSMIDKLDIDSINVCFLNALYYSIYCSHLYLFFNLKNLFENEFKNFSSYNNFIYINPELCNYKKIYNTFCEYFYGFLIEKEKLLGFKFKSHEQKNDESVRKEINEIFKEFSVLNNFGNGSKYKDKFIKLISFMRENINNLKFLKESNIEEFKKYFSSQIYFSYEDIQKNKIAKIYEIISTLDSFFGEDLKKFEIPQFKRKEFKFKLEKILKIFQHRGYYIREFCKNNIDNIIHLLYNKKYILNHLIKSKSYQQILEEINSEIKNHLKEYYEKINIFINRIVLEILTMRDFDFVKKSFLELPKFREKIANAFGCKNKNIDEEIPNEIKISLDNLYKNYDKKGLKGWFSLNLDYQSLEKYCESIIGIFRDKIDHLVNKFEKQYKEYCNDIITLIKNEFESTNIELNKERKENWDILSNIYKDIKNNIIEIKIQIKDEIYSSTLINP